MTTTPSPPEKSLHTGQQQQPKIFSRGFLAQGFLGHRVRIGLLMAVVVFSLIALGGWYWSAFVTVACYLGFQELMAMMALRELRPTRLIALTVGLVLFILATLGKTHYVLPIITVGILASFIRMVFRTPRATMGDIGATFLAIFYLGYLPMHYILIRQLENPALVQLGIQSGMHYLLWTAFTIAASDIGAYYVGKRFGKHLLHAALSPKKTREGTFGGWLTAMAFAILYGHWLGISVFHAVVLSTLLVITGQLGDLAESLLKRDAGLKDSSLVFAGHGGFLDRMDSYLLSGVVAYYYIYWVILQKGLMPTLLRDYWELLKAWQF